MGAIAILNVSLNNINPELTLAAKREDQALISISTILKVSAQGALAWRTQEIVQRWVGFFFFLSSGAKQRCMIGA